MRNCLRGSMSSADLRPGRLATGNQARAAACVRAGNELIYVVKDAARHKR